MRCASTTDPQAQRGEALSTVSHKSAGANEVPFHRWKTEALRSCRSQSTQAGDGSQEVRSEAVTFISVCSLAGPGGPQTGSLRSQMPHARASPKHSSLSMQVISRASSSARELGACLSRLILDKELSGIRCHPSPTPSGQA